MVSPSRPVAWPDGFEADDLRAAFACFQRSAAAIAAGRPELRSARPADDALASICRTADRMGPGVTQAEAAAFFRRHFVPERVGATDGSDGFLTGYYQPVVDGSLTPGTGFTAPLLARPGDLKTFAPDEPRPPDLEGFSAARVAPDGSLFPYPDRAAIEQAVMSAGGAAEHGFTPLVWLRDWVEVFLIHVQGSAQVRLPDGTMLRLSYAGRNGHPYTSIGRILTETGEILPAAMSLSRLKTWMRDHGQEEGQAGRALTWRNASYIFFTAEPLGRHDGPIGGAGVPLTTLRSIAVDRTLWSYGLPFWIEADIPWQSGTPSPMRRLMVAQDTGSAILGPARADLFFGTGDAAGTLAGGIRHPGRFTVLRPLPSGRGAS